MAKFLMLGRYSKDSFKGMSEDRTKKAVMLVQKSGGRMVSMYALLGKYDLAFIVDFPGVKEVMQASIALTKLSGISFVTQPAISIEEFDRAIK